MKIILINPNIIDLEDCFNTLTVRKVFPEPPLGLCYLAAVLERHGHHVKIIDNYLDEKSESDVFQAIQIENPDIVGVSITCLGIERAASLARKIKQNMNVPIIAGGPHATIMPDEILSYPEFDYLITGEGELAFLQLVTSLDAGKNISKIKSLFFYDQQKKLIYTGNGEPIKDLDALPFPARHLIAIEKYKYSARGLLDAKLAITLSSSRGCPYRCSFCSSSRYWDRCYRSRSAANVVDEMEFLKNEYKAEGVIFREDNFLVNRNRVLGICGEIIKRNLKLQWLCECRVDNVDEELLKVMVAAGCKGVWCGVESGSQRILDFIKKDYKIEQVHKAFLLLNKYKIKTYAGFVFGFPHETMNDVKLTLKLAKDIAATKVNFQSYVAYPKSELYEYVLRHGMVDKSWHSTYRVVPDKIKIEDVPALELSLKRECDYFKAKQQNLLKRYSGYFYIAVKEMIGRYPRIKKLLKRLLFRH